MAQGRAGRLAAAHTWPGRTTRSERRRQRKESLPPCSKLPPVEDGDTTTALFVI
jgi:hypothetical protein